MSTFGVQQQQNEDVYTVIVFTQLAFVLRHCCCWHNVLAFSCIFEVAHSRSSSEELVLCKCQWTCLCAQYPCVCKCEQTSDTLRFCRLVAMEYQTPLRISGTSSPQTAGNPSVKLQSIAKLMTHLTVFGEFSSIPVLQVKVKHPPLPPAQCWPFTKWQWP